MSFFFESPVTGFWWAPIIGLWAWLFTGELSKPGSIFAPARSFLFEHLVKGKPEGWRNLAFKILIDCGACHAGQVALWWQLVRSSFGHGFDVPFLIVAMGVATYLQKK